MCIAVILTDRRLSVAAGFQAAEGPQHAERGGDDRHDHANRRPATHSEQFTLRGGRVPGNGGATPRQSKSQMVKRRRIRLKPFPRSI